MMEFLAMGGYATWVWSAFGLTVIVLAANVVAADRRYRQAVDKLRRRTEQSGRRASS